MARTSLLKRCASAFMASLMAVSLFAAALPAKQVAAANINQDANPAPRKTIIRTASVGGCSEGIYSATGNGVFTIRGTGDYFDPTAGGKDKYYYVYMLAQGSTVFTAKITPDKSAVQGYGGVLARNGAQAKDYAAGVYFDYSRQELMAASRNGATTIASISQGDQNGAFYIKLEFNKNSMYYTVARDADFSDIIKARTSLNCQGLNYNNVGFFATMSTVFTASEVEVKSTYTDNSGKEIKKIVYDYKPGEFIPTLSKSSDYSGTYASDFSFTTSVSGNKLNMVSKRTGTSKGEMKQCISTDYLLFPEHRYDMTISADITINSIDTGSNKQGVGIGQFCKEDVVVNQAKLVCSFLHASSYKWTQHSFTTSGGTTNVGYPKSSTISIDGGKTYKLSYTRSSDGTAIMNTYDEQGNLIGDGAAAPFALNKAYTSLQAGSWVQYGIAISGADVSIANLTLTTSDGWILYDQNDYYNTIELPTDKTGGNEEEVEADYSDVDDALKSVPTNLTYFTDESVKVLKDAVNAVVRGKKASEQTQVDAMAKAINDAIAALVTKPVEVKNGLYKEPASGKWYYYVNDIIAVNYTGLLNNGGIWWYIVNGVLADDYTGIVENGAGKWYVKNGKIDVSFTGLGLDNGVWYCVQTGKINMDYTGLVLNAGIWWNIKDGKLDVSYSGPVTSGGTVWYVKNGKLDVNFSGIGSGNGGFWYVTKGKVNVNYTGLVNNNNAWWYIVDGKLAANYTGVVENSAGKWYVKNGKIDVNFTGLYYNGTDWICVRNGKVDMTYTGLILNGGSWWYVVDGKLASNYTGQVVHEGKTWNIVNGKLKL